MQLSVQSCLIIPVTQELPMDTHALLFPLPWSVFVPLSLVMLPVIWVVSFSSRIQLTPLPLWLLALQYLVNLVGTWRLPPIYSYCGHYKKLVKADDPSIALKLKVVSIKSIYIGCRVFVVSCLFWYKKRWFSTSTLTNIPFYLI